LKMPEGLLIRAWTRQHYSANCCCDRNLEDNKRKNCERNINDAFGAFANDVQRLPKSTCWPGFSMSRQVRNGYKSRDVQGNLQKVPDAEQGKGQRGEFGNGFC